MNDNELPIRNDPMMENKNIYIYMYRDRWTHD